MMQTYFADASFFWTTMLSFNLFCIVIKGKIPFKLWHMHAFCWITPAVVVSIPLTMTNYGAPSTDTQWCLLVKKSGFSDKDVMIWSFVNYFAWLIMSIILMTIWGAIAFLKMRSMNDTLSEVVKKCYDKVWLYPGKKSHDSQ